MSDNDSRDSSPTLPPQRTSTPAPEVDIRESSPAIRNAPLWAQDLYDRFDRSMKESMEAERERAEQAHRSANNIANSYLKAAAESELLRGQVEGCRADIRSMRRHLDESLQAAEERNEKRFARIEKRLAALEQKKTS